MHKWMLMIIAKPTTTLTFKKNQPAFFIADFTFAVVFEDLFNQFHHNYTLYIKMSETKMGS